jgi:diguanylate cyclase (GGDEF)-like protein
MADGRNLYSKVMKISDDQLVLNYTDVTSLEQARTDDIIHVLQHDSLTGLPNQVLHKKEVRKRIVDFRREAAKNEKLKDEQFMVLVYFGLNSLNEIYEFLGLSAGDQVVTEIANRCKEFFQDDVHLSHVAYDEFHIITSNENNLNEVLELVEELNKILAAPIKIGENSIEMTISVGISIYPDHADKTDHINRNAKIAYNKAMLTNAYSVVVYDHGMHSEIMERTNMLFDIRDSISKSQFLLHYQPQINIDNRQINGVEALLRWQHPDKGWISPDDFIPLAEHTKQIIPLTEQFLPEACYQAKNGRIKDWSPLKWR